MNETSEKRLSSLSDEFGTPIDLPAPDDLMNIENCEGQPDSLQFTEAPGNDHQPHGAEPPNPEAEPSIDGQSHQSGVLSGHHEPNGRLTDIHPEMMDLSNPEPEKGTVIMEEASHIPVNKDQIPSNDLAREFKSQPDGNSSRGLPSLGVNSRTADIDAIPNPSIAEKQVPIPYDFQVAPNREANIIDNSHVMADVSADQSDIGMSTAKKISTRVQQIEKAYPAFSTASRMETSATAGDDKGLGYIDLAICPLSKGLSKNRQHGYAPSLDAPPYVQMNILLYQWAAWACGIEDETQRARMMDWVSKQTIHFMMSGGRIPDYNLKELLVGAGVDPFQLYGPQGVALQEEIRQGKFLNYLSGKQAPAQARQVDIRNDSTPKGEQLEVVKTVGLPLGSEKDPVQPQNKRSLDEFIDEDTLSEGPTEKRPKPTTDNDIEALPLRQANKRSLDEDSTTEGRPEKQAKPTPSTPSAMAPSDPNRAEEYRQTYFKAQINDILKTVKRSTFRKDIGSWNSIQLRISGAGLAANLTKRLRKDFDIGWKTWDGRAFTELRDEFRVKRVMRGSKSVSVSPPKPKDKGNGEKGKGKDGGSGVGNKNISKTKGNGVDTDDDVDDSVPEQTAKKSSVKTRHQSSSISPKGKNAGKKATALELSE